MFTGIIQEIGKIVKIENINNKRFLTIGCFQLQSDLLIGESVACNGICLTVTHFTSDSIVFETMNQTLKVTTADKWNINTRINMEKALAFNGRLNGHLVQGHVDTTAVLNRKFYEKNTAYLEFKLSRGSAKAFQNKAGFDAGALLVDHGSICIDGVSLSIAKLQPTCFQVALIEHTLSKTNLDDLKSGSLVNVEFDIIGKYIQKMLFKRDFEPLEKKNKHSLKEDIHSKITKEWLSKKGF